MEQITIKVKDSKKARALLNFLKTLEFIENVSTADLPTSRRRAKSSDVDFFALAGIWKGRKISIDSIRQKAWPPRA